MGSMIRELLLTFSIVIVCGGVYIVPKEDLAKSEDVPLEECYVVREGVKRPSVDPKNCHNQYADIPCGYLYPVMDPSSHEDPEQDYLVSSRCYEGDLSEYAEFCASQCALCCETPEFNCTNKLTLEQCDVIAKHELCQEPGMFDFVHYNCRGTCGFCLLPEFNKTICLDNFPYCDELFGLVPCTVPFMHENCAGTCFLTDFQCGFPTDGGRTIFIAGGSGSGGFLGPNVLGPSGGGGFLGPNVLGPNGGGGFLGPNVLGPRINGGGGGFSGSDDLGPSGGGGGFSGSDDLGPSGGGDGFSGPNLLGPAGSDSSPEEDGGPPVGPPTDDDGPLFAVPTIGPDSNE